MAVAANYSYEKVEGEQNLATLFINTALPPIALAATGAMYLERSGYKMPEFRLFGDSK